MVCESAADCVDRLAPASGECKQAACSEDGASCLWIEAADGQPCEAPDACHAAGTCEAGVCLGDQPVVCDDGDACTDDECKPSLGCVHEANRTPCDDGDPCSLEDRCDVGECVGGAAVSCDDGDACTADRCDPTSGVCVNTVDAGAPCDDGSVCTRDDACALSGACVGVAADCGDGEPCTTDSCDPEVGCVHEHNTFPCEDGDACTVGDACSDGACAGGALQGCDDGNPCTADVCDPAAGCVHAAAAGACDDGSACTSGDACVSGACVGEPIPCDDGNVCTNDSCDPVSGCQHAPNDHPCEDADACTLGDTCAADGTCAGGPPPTCDDGNVCTASSCDPAVGCVHPPNEAPCDDGSTCTADDACAGGACGGASTCECAAATDCAAFDDGDACTGTLVCSAGRCVVDAATAVSCAQGECFTATCDPQTGACVATPTADGTGCSDGDACTTADACAAGVCVGGAAPDCEDGNACTLDTCSTAGGCVHVGVGPAGCDDGNPCTTGETCAGSVCGGGAPVACLGSGPCAVATCDATAGGCVVSPLEDGAPCSDGDACTAGDACASGACVATQIECTDANPCTVDGCDPTTGCSFEPSTGGCDDGNACTQGDHCVVGSCVPGPPLSCPQDGACTVSSCDPATGQCMPAAVPDGAPCSDGTYCTAGDSCISGICTGTIETCDDADPCTNDTCDADIGCVHTQSGDDEGCGPCVGLACLDCAAGTCADEGAALFVEGTCCEVGDALPLVGTGVGAEAVDIEVDDRFAYLCGGFGVRINRITDPESPGFTDSALDRCQHIAPGPLLPDGDRIVWFSHHGDSWVPTPVLTTMRVTQSGDAFLLDKISAELVQVEPGVQVYDQLFEGIRYAGGYLYAALHDRGVQVYSVDPESGKPTLVNTVGGFANAWKIEIDEVAQVMYVAD